MHAFNRPYSAAASDNLTVGTFESADWLKKLRCNLKKFYTPVPVNTAYTMYIAKQYVNIIVFMQYYISYSDKT